MNLFIVNTDVSAVHWVVAHNNVGVKVLLFKTHSHSSSLIKAFVVGENLVWNVHSFQLIAVKWPHLEDSILCESDTGSCCKLTFG